MYSKQYIVEFAKTAVMIVSFNYKVGTLGFKDILEDPSTVFYRAKVLNTPFPHSIRRIFVPNIDETKTTDISDGSSCL